MSQDSRQSGSSEPLVKGAKLEPIRVVRRALTRPDGSTLEVDVPVYPPFRLEERPEPPPASTRRTRGKRSG